MALLQFSATGLRLCSSCRLYVAKTTAAGDRWLRGSLRNASSKRHRPNAQPSRKTPAGTSASTTGKTEVTGARPPTSGGQGGPAGTGKGTGQPMIEGNLPGSRPIFTQQHKEPVVLYRLRADRFKYYYAVLFIGLLPIPMYFNEKRMFDHKLKMKARAQARAKVLGEELPEQSALTQLVKKFDKFDGTVLLTMAILSFVVTCTVSLLSLRCVTLWRYDFAKKQHLISTFTPFFKTRTITVAEGKIRRLPDYKTRGVVKVVGRPGMFLLENAHGGKPNVQLFNIILGSGVGNEES